MGKTLSLSVALAALMLTGCTASANLTLDPSSLESEVAAALQEQVGSTEPPLVDCGTEMIDLKDGVEVACVLTDPNTGSEFDAPVVLNSVEGTSYSFDVEVAQEPRN